MPGNTQNRNNQQEVIEGFKTRGAKLFFGLKIFLIVLYILKGLSTFALLIGLTSKEISIILTILIYCIFIYQIGPNLIKTLYGDFVEFGWIKVIVVALTGLNFYLLFNSQFPFLYFPLTLLSGILLGKMMLYKSDMVHWKGPVPTCCNFVYHAFGENEKDAIIEEIKREYRGELDYYCVMRKFMRFVPVYLSGLLFSAYCFFLGFLLFAFIESTILFVFLISLWLMYDLHNLIKKKFLFNLKSLKRILNRQSFSGDSQHSLKNEAEKTQAPEIELILLLLKPKKQALIKQFAGVILIIGGGFFCVGFSAENFLSIISPWDGLMVSINKISLIFAVIFQSYFWYILAQRFPAFLDIWVERDFSIKVDIPRLPPGGFLIFLVNCILIAFLSGYVSIWLSLYKFLQYSNVFYTKMVIGGIAILILLSILEIYLLYLTIKNRKIREKNAKNLYKDNKRIPLAVIMQLFSFIVLSSFALNMINFSLVDLYPKMVMVFFASLIVFQVFYMADATRLLRKRYFEGVVMRKIEEYSLYFIIMFTFFVCGFAFQEIMICNISIFAFAVIALGFIFEIAYVKIMFKLNKIDARKWVKETVKKMESSNAEYPFEWNKFWEETYFALGGKSPTVASNDCPKKAGYTLWYFGRIKGSNKKRVEISIEEVKNRCSKNGAYAILGQKILEKSPDLNISNLFKNIQMEYKKRTNDDPAASDQGGTTLTWILFNASMLK